MLNIAPKSMLSNEFNEAFSFLGAAGLGVSEGVGAFEGLLVSGVGALLLP